MEGEERLKFVLSAANAGLVEWSAAGGLMEFGRGLSLLDCERGEFAGDLDWLFESVHPEDRLQLQDALAVTRRTGLLVVVVRVICPTGEIHVALDGELGFDDEGQLSTLRLFTRDITDERRMAMDLARSESTLAEAQRIVHLGSWDWDIVGGTLSWSDEIYRIFGVEPAAFGATYEAFLEFVHPDDREELGAAVNRALDDPDYEYDIEHRVLRRSGEIRTVRERGRVFRSVEGAPVRMVGTVHDITAQKELERQLLHSQKLDAIGRLAGGVAHDFNNMLTAIIGMSTLVRDALEDDSPLREDLDEILNAAQRGGELTSQLLAFARKRASTPKIVELNGLVVRLDRMLRRLIGADIELVTLPAEEPLPVLVDPGLFEQVIVNLALNARDAMPSGGKLTLALVLQDGGEGQSRWVQLEVADTGVGMSPEVCARVFEPFFTTKPRGTGLGLASSYGVITQAGGELLVESVPGVGSVFRIMLPRASELPSEATAVRQRLPGARGEERILVVDDEVQIRRVVERTLVRAGYAAVAVANGSEALEYLRSHDVDLLVTDIVMPQMSGTELLERARELQPQLEALLMSGYSVDSKGRPQQFDAGVAFLTKPFLPHTLCRRVRELLDGKPSS
jgi:two-component system cell cycle sensor histidine kinase/response regulator CckA